jgi:hypothetical protein
VVSDFADRPEDRVPFGSWVPLTHVVRDAEALRRIIYRLVADGKLRSRESLRGEIEIWVNDSDRASDSVALSAEVVDVERPPAQTHYDPSAIGHQFAVLIGPLASAYERNVQLAHDNGALGERAASLERELQALRETTASDRRALEQANARLQALEPSRTRPAEQSSANDPEPPSRRRWSWVLLVIGALLCLAALGVSLIGRPF